jgi:hypothetical protein
MIRWQATLLFTGAILLSPAVLCAAETDPKVVKLPELINAIKAHKGKVVVIDFWADG